MKLAFKVPGIEYLDDYIKLANSTEVALTTEPGSTRTFSHDEIANWIQKIGSNQAKTPLVEGSGDRVDWMIIEADSGGFVGEVVLNEMKNGEANIRIALLPDFWGKGICGQAMSAIIAYAFQSLGLERITLGVYDINPRGKALYHRLGFVEIGREVEDGYVFIDMELTPESFSPYSVIQDS